MSIVSRSKRHIFATGGVDTHVATGRHFDVDSGWRPITACGLDPRHTGYPKRVWLDGKPDATCGDCQRARRRDSMRILADRREELDRRRARKRQGVPKGPASCDGRTRGAFGRLV